MHAGKALDVLFELASNSDIYEVETFMRFDFIAGKLQEDLEGGEIEGKTVDIKGKLRSACNWMEIAAGLGEDNGWTEAQLRTHVQQDVIVLRKFLSADRKTFEGYNLES